MSQTTTDSHVAVLNFPFGTHARPLFIVIHRIATFSPHTLFSFFNTSKSNDSILSIYRQDMQPNIKAYDVWDGVPAGSVLVRKPEEEIELFLKSAPESFKKGIETAVAESGRRVSCLVSDAFLWFAAEMAEDMEVPWVPFWAPGHNSLSAHVYTDFLREIIGVAGVAGREDENLNFIPGMSKVRIRDLPEGVVFGELESPFSQMLQKMGAALPQAEAVFINSFEELDPIITNNLQSKFKKFLNIGPLNLISPPPAPDTYSCLPWLDKQKPASVAYIGFGSVITPPPHELAALAEALEANKTPFIWSLKENSQMHLPNGFLERTKTHGIVVPWAPQVQVLSHSAVGVFVTHCGWNSLLEAILGGVPMICRPLFGDHRLNGRMIEDVWEIGVSVEGGVFTKNALISSLDQILLQEKGKRMKKNIKNLKELAEKTIAAGGSSCNNFIALSNLISSTKKC